MSLKPVINNQTYFADLLTLSSGHLNIGSSFPEDKQLRILLVKYPEVFCEDRFELGFGGSPRWVQVKALVGAQGAKPPDALMIYYSVMTYIQINIPSTA